MKVKITYTVDYSDEFRRALYYNRNGFIGNPHECPMVGRYQLQYHARDNGSSCDADILYEYRRACDNWAHNRRLNHA